MLQDSLLFLSPEVLNCWLSHFIRVLRFTREIWAWCFDLFELGDPQVAILLVLSVLIGACDCLVRLLDQFSIASDQWCFCSLRQTVNVMSYKGVLTDNIRLFPINVLLCACCIHALLRPHMVLPLILWMRHNTRRCGGTSTRSDKVLLCM
jgi:hypothetical protein